MLPVLTGIHAIHLRNPSGTFLVGHRQDFVVIPAQPDGDKRYLLVQAVEGVAYDPPSGGTSSSNSWWQFGQTTRIRCGSTSLICRYRSCK